MSKPVARVDAQTLRRRVRVALGQEPGDLVLRDGQVVNVFTEQVETANVVLADGWIAGVGLFEWPAHETVSLSGQAVLPGLIDAHMHLESTLLLPGELAKVIVPHGTTTVVADPHEIANVAGVAGIELLIHASTGLPLDVFFMAPSCVPASPWESAGAVLDAATVEEVLKHPGVLGLAEMMNFPGVINQQPEVLQKIAGASSRGMPVDGHAPGLTGQQLLAYAAAGIHSDHESITVEEALAKAALGMLVQVREGSSARSLDCYLPLLAEGRLGDWCLVTDDIHVDDLMDHGHMDNLLRRVVAAGVPAAHAVRHLSLIPARHYGLSDRGAIAPGYRADLLVVQDLTSFEPHTVIKNGQIVARTGVYQAEERQPAVKFENTVRLARLDDRDFELRPNSNHCPVIGIVPDTIVTRHESRSVRADPATKRWVFDPEEDVSLVACVERHRATGRVGMGLARGFGFRRAGALGSSVAHDAHNLVTAGTNPGDMLACVRTLEEMGGGLVVVSAGSVVARLPLQVAGLVSTENSRTVRRQLGELTEAARSLGCTLPAPFGTLSFLCLSVIPELRITDRGVLDVVGQRLIEL
ncbi:MAG: adenine deaminase [Phycisphaerales bacterium]|nr:MAG: adenine deaminase [Phycisphaerales bacterium]